MRYLVCTALISCLLFGAAPFAAGLLPALADVPPLRDLPPTPAATPEQQRAPQGERSTALIDGQGEPRGEAADRDPHDVDMGGDASWRRFPDPDAGDGAPSEVDTWRYEKGASDASD